MLEIGSSELLQAIWTLSWLGALLTVPSVLLQRSGRPNAALTWLLALFALPAVALAAWWLFGRVHLRRRRKRRRQVSQTAAKTIYSARTHMLKAAPADTLPAQTTSRLAPHMPPDLCDGVFPTTTGNQVSLLPNTAVTQQAWLQLVQGADQHLHLLFYIWRDDRIGRRLRDRLIEKAKQGVEVRVLYDAVGSFGLPGRFFDRLIESGGQVARFMPVRLMSATPTLNFRNHRKLLIADGQRAYTGGINVGDEFLDWQDLGIAIDGPGVNQLQEVFVDDWFFATGEELAADRYFCELSTAGAVGDAICETIASGPDQTFNTTREMVFLAIAQCRRRLWIATPYFVPDETLLLALRTAVYRGVDVRLFVPEHNNHWLVRRASYAFYPELLQGDVHIFEYRGMLHAKAMLLDEDAVLIGSANLDIRSFRLNFELSTFVNDMGLNRELATLFQGLQANAINLTLEDVQRVSSLSRLLDVLAHLLSPLL